MQFKYFDSNTLISENELFMVSFTVENNKIFYGLYVRDDLEDSFSKIGYYEDLKEVFLDIDKEFTSDW